MRPSPRSCPERGRIARLAYALESRWPAVIASLAATAALVWLIVAVALPRAAEPIARRLSPEVDRFLGQQVLATLDKTVFKPTDLSPDAEEEWRRKFDDFVAGEPGAEHYAIVFRHAGAPNAFALPDGTIVVTDEMVRAVGSDDEFRAVLAHEIGHIRGRHALRLVLQRSGIAVLLTALAGDAVGVTYLAVALPSMLLQSSYSREFEAEADDFAFAQSEASRRVAAGLRRPDAAAREGGRRARRQRGRRPLPRQPSGDGRADPTRGGGALTAAAVHQPALYLMLQPYGDVDATVTGRPSIASVSAART